MYIKFVIILDLDLKYDPENLFIKGHNYDGWNEESDEEVDKGEFVNIPFTPPEDDKEQIGGLSSMPQLEVDEVTEETTIYASL